MLCLAGAALLLSACQKEDTSATVVQGLVLSMENFRPTPATKTETFGNNIRWNDGDQVLLGGETYSVSVADGTAKVLDFEGSGALTGFFPTDVVTAGASTNTPTVNLPNAYTSTYTDSWQHIALPMAASTPSVADGLRFRHISSAVCVRVMNATNHPLYLDSVVVISSQYQLCGSRQIVLDQEDMGLDATPTDDASKRRVRVQFERHTTSLLPDAILDVQVPIYPIDADAAMTVRVYAHRYIEGMAADATLYTFDHTTTAPALPRNAMMKAQIKIDPTSDHVSVDDRGFSVGSGKKVYFSQGNLKYIIASKKWYFQEQQYGISEAMGNVGENYSNATEVGLFGWGTNGVPNEGYITDPTSTSKTGTYGPSANLDPTSTDWGHNPIENGGGKADQWRTLSSVEWNYLLISRTASTVGGVANAKFARAKLKTINGVILFPDNFTPPHRLQYQFV